MISFHEKSSKVAKWGKQIHYKHIQPPGFILACWRKCVFCFVFYVISEYVCAIMCFCPERSTFTQTHQTVTILHKTQRAEQMVLYLNRPSQWKHTFSQCFPWWAKKDTMSISLKTFGNGPTRKQHTCKYEDSPSMNLPGKQRESFKGEYCRSSTGF